MTYLLDTHMLLWFTMGDRKLSRKAKSILRDESNTILLSAASVWEMAIKISLGKLILSMPLKEYLREHVQGNNITILDIAVTHLLHTGMLPFIHRDPFDRLIISQAIIEDIPIITADQHFKKYPVVCMQ
jgi:PIN domain nuclease of toxin-antitoxin system